MSAKKFLDSSVILVVGASTNRDKFGNKVFRALTETFMKGNARNARYRNAGNIKRIVPINPREPFIEDVAAFPSVTSALDYLYKPTPNRWITIQEEVGVSIITAPPISNSIIKECLPYGIENFWLQPGAEDVNTINIINDVEGLNVLCGGPCVLVELQYSESL